MQLSKSLDVLFARILTAIKLRSSSVVLPEHLYYIWTLPQKDAIFELT